MTRVWVTGSTDGIGRETAATLARNGHEVLLHARDPERAKVARVAVPGAAAVLVGDLASLEQVRALAEQTVAYGDFDVIIHNCGIQLAGSHQRSVTEDGLERTFQVNVLAPYLLTALMHRPKRLIYLTSGLQASGVADLDDLQRERRPWDGTAAYCDSKLYDVMLAFAVAQRWPDVFSNAVDPGWIRTRMGGRQAPDSLAAGAETQIWLATSDDPRAKVTGRYLKRRNEQRAHRAANDPAVRARLLDECARLTGVTLPR